MPKPAPLVTLTTDFGIQDPYVAAVKGVLHSQCPKLRTEDLTHEIGPQNLLECAFFVAASAPFFPPGTVHLVVVDPGVGSERMPVAVQAGGQLFVCPDNGVLTILLQSHGLEAAHKIRNPEFMREDISPTFHGRDVFAVAAGKLAAGAPLPSVGPAIDTLVQLDVPAPKHEADGRIQGTVVRVDRFGNCITNIHQRDLQPAAHYAVQFGATALNLIQRTYAAASPGATLALFGGSGYLEIAVREGDANERLGLVPGEPVTLYLR